MFNGLSGVGRFGDNMSVLADNISNINTVGFKSSRVSFEEIIHSVLPQKTIGSGVALTNVVANFNAGSLTDTNVSTDVAINGKGFFIVNDGSGSPDLYTRDGQFIVRESENSQDLLQLTTATGLLVQGYAVDATTGTLASDLSPIILNRICAPKATENLTAVFNLQYTGEIEQTNEPLYASWDGSRVDFDGQSDPISADAFTYSSPLKIFDEDGNRQDLTIYFDNTDSSNQMEFLLTCNPAGDRRLIDGGPARYNDPGIPLSSGAGALLYGILDFSPHGDLVGISAYRVPADSNVDPPSSVNQLQLGRGDAYYSFDFKFSGIGENRSSTINFGTKPTPQTILSPMPLLLSPAGQPADYPASTSTWNEVYDSQGRMPQAGDTITFTGTDGAGNAVNFSFTINPASAVSDLLVNLEAQFDCTASLNGGRLQLTDSEIGTSQLNISSIGYRDAAGNDPSTNALLAEPFDGQGASFEVQRQNAFQLDTLSTTAYASPSATLNQSQDGYGTGYLTDLQVGHDGVVSGYYSNGQQVVQATLALADFTDYAGLMRAGSNLYTVTDEAGTITLGKPREGSFGAVTGGALEASNVDLSDQFSQLIITQRIYQANAKSISTADEVYQTVIRLKS